MNMTEVTEVNETPEDTCSNDYHILTFAETGFAVLSSCAEQFGLDWKVVEQFSDQINETDETGSLHPKARISAVPRHLIRENNDSNKLAGYIRDFFDLNMRRIKAKKVIIDFRAGLAPFVVVACRNASTCKSAGFCNQIIIVTE